MYNIKLSKKVLAQYNKFLDIDACLELFKNRWEDFIPFLTLVGLLQANLLKVKNTMHNLLDNHGNEFDVKLIKKKDLCKFTSDKCKIMLGFCDLEEHPELEGNFKYKYNKLFKLPDNELSIVCGNIKDTINSNLSLLVDYKINAATITTFETKINDFVTAKSSVVTNEDGITDQYKYLRKLIKDHEKLIGTSLNLVTEFEESEPKFYNNYMIANQLHDPSYSDVSIYSNVKDKESAAPLALATVTMELIEGIGDTKPGTKYEKLTNLQGYFRFIEIPSGWYKLTVKRFAYKLFEMNVEIIKEIVVNPEILLEKK